MSTFTKNDDQDEMPQKCGISFGSALIALQRKKYIFF